LRPFPAFAFPTGANQIRSEPKATPEQERAYLAQFENFSNEQIRHELVHGFVPGEFTHALTVYLSKREMDSSSEQIATARRAADAAERASSAAERAATATESQAAEVRRANKKANVALAIAIISPIITAIIAIVGIVVSHLDVHK
jgi:hypothetical protein